MRKMTRGTLLVASGLAALAVLGSANLKAQGRPAGLNPAIESLTGSDTFERYCAGCHGLTGHGDGPVAGSLKTPVPDLTTMALRNGGEFPRERARAAVVNTERPITAHGTGDMPVWGWVFKVIEPSEVRADVRIDNVVAYIETLQQPPVVSVAAGRQIFMTYCASCHGAEGRGGGPMAAQLRAEVPDLTQFAVRNGGVFPTARVRQIIDGRLIPSHGTGEMPVWGDAFRSAPDRPDERGIAARISAVTMFLESIQLRRGE
jgi:mono/diheme cytochrome c family protein